MAFLDKVLGKDERERKLEKEIRSLELRKESVFSAIDGEIARLQRERSNVLLTAGTAAYEAWKKENVQADLTEFWDKIQELDKQIAEQDAKKTEMGIKYDEEIRLINCNLSMNTEKSVTDVSTGNKCPKCGAVISADDVFCQGCGTKLQ